MFVADILLSLVQGEAGLNWARERKGWDESTYVCEWEGIGCDDQNDVTVLNLENSDLIGTIPRILMKLSSLEHLLLSKNKLFGMTPPGIGNLIGLKHIDLSSNKLYGHIPLMKSPILEIIDMSDNLFSGTLPSKYGNNLHSLRELNLKKNIIGGTLPHDLVSMESLVELDLSHNKFYGPIPDNLRSLTNLEAIYFNNNNLSGNLPASLTKDHILLKKCFLQGNKLTGTLPVSLASLPSLEVLIINDNKFTGTVPQELCKKSINEVFFGSVSEKTRRQNGCNYIGCPVGSRSVRFGGNDGVFPCVNCQDKGANPFIGAKSCQNPDPKDILEEFYVGAGGENWNDPTTWIDNDIPICKKAGINCDVEGNIISIRLPQMNMSGTISESIGFLRHLDTIDLKDNFLYGDIPVELAFLPLETLDVSGNMLTGLVPPALCRKHGIHKNGKNGDFNCNVIACPMGTYSVTGHSDAGAYTCVPCKDAIYLGCRTCSSVFKMSDNLQDKTRNSGGASTMFPLVFSVVTAIAILFLLFAENRRDGKKDIESEAEDEPYTKHTIDHKLASRSFLHDIRGHFLDTDIKKGTFPSEFDKNTNGGVVGKEEDEEHNRRSVVWLDVPKIS